MKERKIIKIGKESCGHEWKQETRRWNELALATDNPKKDKLNTWRCRGDVSVCEKCGRVELLGGTILIPEGGDYFDGEYGLEPDGSRGLCLVLGGA